MVQKERESKIKKYGLENYKLYMEKEKQENELYNRFKMVAKIWKEKIMDGLERLEKEAVEMNNHNVILIFNYIKEKESLRDKFNNEEKTIKGMYEFICNKARTVSQNNVAIVQDNIVYLWAMAYFNKTNEELGINKKVSTPKKETKKTEVKKEELKKKKKYEKKNNKVSLFEEVKK